MKYIYTQTAHQITFFFDITSLFSISKIKESDCLILKSQYITIIIKMIKYMNENQNVWITFNNVTEDK